MKANTSLRPFLKWPGNKHQLVCKIKQILPSGKRLIEPFLGTGALFLNTNFQQYLLSDINKDLIEIYLQLKKTGDKFITEAQKWFQPQYNCPEAFYDIRERFNQSNNKKERALLFIYLNRHCFNGLCRYNKSGEFNVPFGRYNPPYFPSKEMQQFHKKAQGVTFKAAHFETIIKQAQPGDVIYCDPPYVPLSKTAKFTQYSPYSFGEAEQIRLAEWAGELSAASIPVIISNHNTDFIQTIYRKAKIHELEVKRVISCNKATRKPAKEILALFS